MNIQNDTIRRTIVVAREDGLDLDEGVAVEFAEDYLRGADEFRDWDFEHCERLSYHEVYISLVKK